MQAWDDFVKKQEALLGKEIAEKWLRSLKVVHFDSCNLYLEAKDSFQVLWFEEHMRPLLKTQLYNNNFRPIKVHLASTDASSVSSLQPLKKDKTSLAPSVDFYKDKINPSMTMENFVVGDANQLIFRFFCELTGYSGSSQIPLASFNPIYLSGVSGSGKTHLFMALEQEFKKKGLKTLYARAETFTEHVVSAIRNSEMQSFRKTYRNVDVLLIDDVHVFANKDATQEEFFHTFNALHTGGKQILLSSKYSPSFLQRIEQRLISRFEWGIHVCFEKLKPKDLKQVLKKQCEEFHFPLSEEVADFLIETFDNTSSLQRALEALILRSHMEMDPRLKKNSLTMERDVAKKILSDLSAEEIKNALTPEKILSIVASSYGISVEDLLGKSQHQDCSFPRQVAMYLCREELRLPFQKIGYLFSRDHSTVMTSVKQIEKKIEYGDKELLRTLSEIRFNT